LKSKESAQRERQWFAGPHIMASSVGECIIGMCGGDKSWYETWKNIFRSLVAQAPARDTYPQHIYGLNISIHNVSHIYICRHSL